MVASGRVLEDSGGTDQALSEACTPCTDNELTLSCTVCVSEAWSAFGQDQPSPVSGCFVCPDLSWTLSSRGPYLSALAGCQPCGPFVDALVFVDSSSTIWYGAGADACSPCPAPDIDQDAAGPVSPDALVPGDLDPDISIPPDEPTIEDVLGLLPAEQDSDCARVHLDQRLYYLQDEQRSVYGLANETGVVVEGYEYDPYGRVLVLEPGVEDYVTFTTGDTYATAGDAETPYQYTARRYDPETGLLYFRTRYYDDEMGRFISKDTIGVWGDPNSLGNAYGYTANGPHQHEDPTGEKICWKRIFTFGWKKCKKPEPTPAERLLEELDAQMKASVGCGSNQAWGIVSSQGTRGCYSQVSCNRGFCAWSDSEPHNHNCNVGPEDGSGPRCPPKTIGCYLDYQSCDPGSGSVRDAFFDDVSERINPVLEECVYGYVNSAMSFGVSNAAKAISHQVKEIMELWETAETSLDVYNAVHGDVSSMCGLLVFSP